MTTQSALIDQLARLTEQMLATNQSLREMIAQNAIMIDALIGPVEHDDEAPVSSGTYLNG